MSKADAERLERLFASQHNLSREEKGLVHRAYFFSKKAHRGQKRKSGKPYFLHTYKTALKLAELKMDGATIAAGLLHDTIEDGHTEPEDLEKTFGKDVRFLVEGVTKLGKLKYHGLKRHTESLRKLFIAMSHDIRVLIIKLADRLHNMETLFYVPKEKQRRIALETLEIYAPLAHRLGIGQFKGPLEDLAFKYVLPEQYAEVEQLRKQKGKENVKRVERVAKILKRKMADEKIKVVKTDYRIKHLYSLYQKLEQNDMNIEKIYDIAALRVIVPSIDDCYRVLGIIHKRWKPLPGRIKDYIATPKPNGYQSLHTTIFTGDGAIIEIQVRTAEMHQEAEYGVASHVAYKEGGDDPYLVRLLKTLLHRENQKQQTGGEPAWVKELAEVDRETHDPQEFLQTIKEDFFGNRVFVFTPKGEVLDLPEGATPIDFAYAIHTDIGGHTASAKINGKMVSLDTILQNGDIVEIEAKETSRPTRKWLENTKSTFARRKIRQTLEKNDKEKR